MVKLASARETRIYGPITSRTRWEYINAAVYVFATVLLLAGSAAQLSTERKSGLFVLLLGFFIVFIVNLHDLVAHLAGIDFRVVVMRLDLQFALVEFAVPVVCALGSFLQFLAILFLLIQAGKGYGYKNIQNPAMGMLIAGPALWLLGSIHNSCQIYESSGAQVQVLQQSVILPFSMTSLLFLIASIINSREQIGYDHYGYQLLGETWVWIWIFGSLILFIGALANVFKVFKMQQRQDDGWLRLEKLRGGAQERLLQGEGSQPAVDLMMFMAGLELLFFLAVYLNFVSDL